MRKVLSAFFIGVVAMATAQAGRQTQFSGDYTATVDGKPAALKLTVGSDGVVTGSLVGKKTYSFSGKAAGEEITGILLRVNSSERSRVRMRLQGEKLTARIVGPSGGTYHLAFDRKRPATPQDITSRKLAAVPAKKAGTSPTPSVVLVNGEPVSESALRQLRGQFGVSVPPGLYWYDRVSGAWGFQGGLMRGITRPDIPFGSRLRPDASQGRTGIFINGRELPELEVRAYAQIGIRISGKAPSRTNPKRFTLDAQGNIRWEGQTEIRVNVDEKANAAAKSAPIFRRAPQEGYANDRGQTGFLFDPAATN